MWCLGIGEVIVVVVVGRFKVDLFRLVVVLLIEFEGIICWLKLGVVIE